MKPIHHKTKKTTWYILGAGAMGCLWACYYRQAGFPVVLITREPRLQTTLNLFNTSGDHQFTVTYKTIDQINETINSLMVCTKAQQTVNAIDTIKSHLNKQASVLVLQNGLISEQLPEQLATQKLFAAVTTDGAYRTNNNSVIHAGIGHTLIGTVSTADNDTNTDAVNKTMNETDTDTLIQQLPGDYLLIKNCKNIKQQQWKKLAYNCVINGLTAIYQCRNGDLLTIDDAHQQLKTLCEETFHIVDSLGITLCNNAQSLYNDIHSACTLTANNYSSMYQDIKHKRPTEIDFFNGYLCEQAEKIAVDCRENKRILEKIKQLELAT